MKTLTFLRQTIGIGRGAICAFLAALCLGAWTAQADMLMIGNSGGEVFGRDEYDLATHIPTSYINYGGGVSIKALAAGAQGDVAIGINSSPNVSVRNNLTLGTVITSVSTGNNATALAAGSSGQLAIGDSGNLVFLRQLTDLLAYPAGYTSTDGLNFNAPIAGLGILPGGNVLIANTGGEVFIRSGTDLFTVPSGIASGYVNYGTPLSAISVNAAGQIVLSLQGGLVDVRDWTNLGVSLTNVNFGQNIPSLAAMNNGTVAIGLSDGRVSLRPLSDITAQNQILDFTGGSAITALTLSSEGNLGIGTANNLVFVRQGTDLTQKPAGYVGPDGLNFNAPITALTFAIPEPSVLGLGAMALLGGVILAVKRRAVVR